MSWTRIYEERWKIPLTLGLTALLSIALFHFMFYQDDSGGYTNAVRLMFGFEGEEDRLHRLVKPMALLLPGLAHWLGGLDPVSGLWAQQIFAYFFCGAFFYKLLRELRFSEAEAYCGMLILVLSQPMVIYGLAVLTDAVGWGWGLAGVWWARRLVARKKVDLLACFAFGTFMGLGFFAKESALIGGAFFGIYMLICRHFSWPDKLKSYLATGLGFLIIIVIVSLWTHFQFGTSMLTWVKFAHSDPPDYTWRVILLQTFRTLDVYWFLVGLGCIRLGQLAKQKKLSLAILSIALTAVICLGSLFLVWPYIMDRILFMVMPFFMVIAVLGLHFLRRLALPVVLIGGALNLGMTWGIYGFQIGGLLIMGYSLYIILLGLGIWRANNAS